MSAAPPPVAASAPVAVAGLPASSPGQSIMPASSVESGAPAHSQAVPGSLPLATAAHAVCAPAEQTLPTGLTAQQGNALLHSSSVPALPPVSSPQQQSPGRQPDEPQPGVFHEHDSIDGSASLAAPKKHELQPTGTNGALWDLTLELQTLREHLAWLANSNVVCSVEACPSLCRSICAIWNGIYACNIVACMESPRPVCP